MNLRRLRRVLIVSLLALLGLTALSLAFPRTRYPSMRAVIAFDLAYADRRYVRGLPAVGSIEVCHLAERAVPGATDLIFGLLVIGSTLLTGRQAQQLAAAWRLLRIETDYEQTSLCHLPRYGLRFHQHGKMVLRSSFCWMSENLTAPSLLSELTFARDVAAGNFWAQLQTSFPLPKPATEFGMPP